MDKIEEALLEPTSCVRSFCTLQVLHLSAACLSSEGVSSMLTICSRLQRLGERFKEPRCIQVQVSWQEDEQDLFMYTFPGFE